MSNELNAPAELSLSAAQVDGHPSPLGSSARVLFASSRRPLVPQAPPPPPPNKMSTYSGAANWGRKREAAIKEPLAVNLAARRQLKCASHLSSRAALAPCNKRQIVNLSGCRCFAHKEGSPQEERGEEICAAYSLDPLPAGRLRREIFLLPFAQRRFSSSRALANTHTLVE